MEMRWFTHASLFGPDERDSAAEYAAHRESIRASLPDSVAELADRVELHDARVEALEVGPDSVRLTAITNTSAATYERILLDYGGASIIDPAPGSLAPLHLLCGDVELFYDEVDLTSDGRYVHRGFVLPTGQFSIVFDRLEVTRASVTAEVFRTLHQRPPAPESSRILDDAWLDYDPPLCKSAAIGSADEVEAMIKAGISPHTACNLGLTPLHHAAKRNRLDVCRVLVEGGAVLDAQDEWGSTPLALALGSGNMNVVDYLVAHGANPLGAWDDGGVEALCVSVSSANVASAAFALDHGAPINGRDEGGFSALMRAAEDDRGTEMVRFLLSKGADPRLRTPSDTDSRWHEKRPSELAARMHNIESAALLAAAEAETAWDQLPS